jgi:hypothetical protein
MLSPSNLRVGYNTIDPLPFNVNLAEAAAIQRFVARSEHAAGESEASAGKLPRSRVDAGPQALPVSPKCESRSDRIGLATCADQHGQ